MSSADLADLKPVYLIYGSEDLLLERAVGRLKDRLAEVADLAYNFYAYDGETTDVDAVVAAANTLPFLSERRLVIVRRVDRMPTAAQSVLADYALNPNPTTTLVLVAEKVNRGSRLFKAVDALGGAAEYAAPKKHEYAAVVEDMFARRGKRIGTDATEVLVRAVGYDLRRLDVEVEKVAAYTGERAVLSREDVEEVMSTTAPTSVFDFLDALGSRDVRHALRTLGSLLDEGESVFGVHAMAVRHVRSLLGVRALRERADGPATSAAIAPLLGLREWQTRNLMRQADRFTSRELVDALRAAARCEERMKTSRDARLVFERWVVSVAA